MLTTPVPDATVLPPATPPADPVDSGVRMTPLELRSSLSLSSLFALRMLGLFLVLPVFALEAARLPGGGDPAWVGLAMGVYGLSQALLQIPFGMASDRWGRKPVIALGLVVFALGSLWAALAPSVGWLAAGRALQGAGAISAAVSALLADQTRDAVRTKAMALVGASIGFMFALSLVLAPALNALIGLGGLFGLTALLAVLGLAVVRWWVPTPAPVQAHARGRLAEVLRQVPLLRLNAGVFILHAVQLAMWVAVPALLVQAGLGKAQHWQAYLPAVLGSFVVMGASLFRLERAGYLRAVFLASIALLLLVQVALAVLSAQAAQGVSVALLVGVLFVFFYGFNVLEASQPSLVSRLAPAHARGTAMGVYNTLQSLGFFVGGAAGGWCTKYYGAQGLFLACSAAMALWLMLAWPMQAPASVGRR